MTAAPIKQCDHTPREHMLARIASPAAVAAPPDSYLANAGTANNLGITLKGAQGALIAVAPSRWQHPDPVGSRQDDTRPRLHDRPVEAKLDAASD